MNSSVVIVINIVCNCFREDLKRSVFFFTPIKHLIFEPAKECFHNAIVVAIPFSGHGLNDLMLLKFASICCVLVLPALIRMHNQSIHTPTTGAFSIRLKNLCQCRYGPDYWTRSVLSCMQRGRKLGIYGSCPMAGEIQTMGQVDIDKSGLSV